MCAENENNIVVEQTRTFSKAFKRLSETQKDSVEDEIEKIIKNPNIGTRKRADLSHLWVHKFKLNNAKVLPGYS